MNNSVEFVAVAISILLMWARIEHRLTALEVKLKELELRLQLLKESAGQNFRRWQQP